MDFDWGLILSYLAATWPFIQPALIWLGLLVVAGQVVVLLTPTKKDDAAWAKLHAIPVLGRLLAALAAFAPIQRK